MRGRRVLAGVLSAAAVSSWAFAPARAAACGPMDQPASLVAPESLSQGFILVVEDKGQKADNSSPIYFASNITGWNPGDAAYKLQPQSDLRWRIVLPQPPAGTSVEFKFTRGTWETVEIGGDLKDLDNRALPHIDVSKLKPGEKPLIELAVAKWRDQRPGEEKEPAFDPYKPIVATGTLKRVEFIGGSGGAEGRMREALVWLPPGYDDPQNAEHRYPVLYMFDGQNLFAKHAGVASEWGVDETATRLIRAREMEPVIVVGLPHGGPARVREYLPLPALPMIAPAGAKYLDLVVNQIKPRIDRLFRTDTGPDRTAIGGSSLGGAMALYAGTTRPEVFGMVLAESLPLRTGRAEVWDSYVDGVKRWPRKVYLGMGGKETGPGNDTANAGYVEAVKRLESIITRAGGTPDQCLLVIDADARHTEAAWAARLPKALVFLFPPSKK